MFALNLIKFLISVLSSHVWIVSFVYAVLDYLADLLNIKVILASSITCLDDSSLPFLHGTLVIRVGEAKDLPDMDRLVDRLVVEF